MILDAIVTFLAVFAELFFAFFTGLLNLLIILLELIIRMFNKSYTLNKIPKKSFRHKSEDENTDESAPPQRFGRGSIIALVVILIVILTVEFKDKEIHFLATDGNSLPYAEIVITTNNEVIKKRTSISGKIEVPRFGLISLKVKDPRYKDQTWSGEEIKSELVVKRSLIGSGLDSVVDFIKKEKK